MDIVAHALWAGAGGRWLERRALVGRGTLWGIVALAVAPDVVPMAPVVVHALSGADAWGLVAAYAGATPATEPALPPAIAVWTHHLHCAWHSLVVVGAVTAAAWLALARVPLVLLGWWSHVLIDIPTHSADFYAARPLYPLSDAPFDGIAWNEPAMLAANYAALAVTYAWLLRRRGRAERAAPAP